MDRFLLDIRLGLRGLARGKGLTLGAALALALGVGATTTMFSIIHGGTRDLPFAEPRELVVLARTIPRLGVDDLAPRPFDYLSWSAEARSFEAMAAVARRAVNLSDAEHGPERASGALVTPDAFRVVGVGPALGRTFAAADAAPGAPATVVIGHDLWERRYDADPGILGRSIRVNGAAHTVIGVMPAGFGFPIHENVWLPLGFSASIPPDEGIDLIAFGRLRDGASLDRARVEMATIGDRLARAQPRTHADLGVSVRPFADIEMDPGMVPILYLMLFAVSFVLLIACANVANLLLARAATRTREVAVETALGASRARIVGRHLFESAVIALLGGLGGVAIAYVAVGFFDRASADILEAFWVDFRVDRTVLAFSSGLVGAAAILAGILPAVRASRTSVTAVLKDESTASGLRIGRVSRGLLVAEVALACGLLVVSGMLVRAALGLRAISLPFDARDIFSAQVGLTVEAFGGRDGDPDGTPRARTVSELARQLVAIPGTRAALASVLPGRGAGDRVFRLDGEPPPESGEIGTSTGVAMVSPGFLGVLGSRPARGRDLRWSDDRDAPPVALVNRSWVERFSAARDPIGRTLQLYRYSDRAWVPSGEPITVVGVVPDLQMQDPEDARGDGVYLSILQHEPYSVRVLARASGDPLALTGMIREGLRAVDPDLPLFEIATLYDAIYADKRVLDAFGTLFGVFGAGALFLTVIGLYGVVAFGVARRTREVGVRMALGARRADILGLIVRQGAGPLAIGGGLGLLLALALGFALSSALEFVSPADPVVFAGVLGSLALTALGGLLLPARRAAALDPLEALRHS